MLVLFVSVMIASLLGSLHCAGMCGAFLMLAVTPNPGSMPPSRVQVQMSYHLGRLITYTTLGLLAGLLGAMVNLASALAGLQPVATSIAGAIMIWFGLSILLRRSGIKIPKMPLPGFLQRLATRGHTSAMHLPPLMRAGVIGLLTTLLPCGWLYAFVVVAAGTASPLTGALVMLAFWVGTLPILIALGTGLQHGLGALGRKLPVITSIIVVIAGMYALTGRTLLDVRAMASALEPEKIPSAVPSAQSKMPCCAEEK